jgi:mono/diheme cytochrome c family protein
MRVLGFLVRAIGILILVVIGAVVALIIQGRGLATRAMPNPATALRLTPDSTLYARGQHIVRIECAGCHASSLEDDAPLTGSRDNFFDIPKGPLLGSLYAPNLTPAGPIGRASDAQIARAIREGVSFEGRPLIVMPSPHYHLMSDRDLAAVIAWIRHQAPIPTTPAARKLNLLADLVLGLHQAETSVQSPILRAIEDTPEDSTKVYGAYLTPILGCSDCHGADYKGAKSGQLAPKGPNLTRLVNDNPYEVFELALRHGVKIEGGTLDPTAMPWGTFARLSDVEAHAVYAYLKSLPK